MEGFDYIHQSLLVSSRSGDELRTKKDRGIFIFITSTAWGRELGGKGS